MQKSVEERGKVFKYPLSSFFPLLPRNPNGNGSPTVSRWEPQRLPPGRYKIRWNRSNGFQTSGPLVHTGVRELYPGPTVWVIIPRSSLIKFSGPFKVSR